MNLWRVKIEKRNRFLSINNCSKTCDFIFFILTKMREAHKFIAGKQGKCTFISLKKS